MPLQFKIHAGVSLWCACRGRGKINLIPKLATTGKPGFKTNQTAPFVLEESNRTKDSKAPFFLVFILFVCCCSRPAKTMYNAFTVEAPSRATSAAGRVVETDSASSSSDEEWEEVPATRKKGPAASTTTWKCKDTDTVETLTGAYPIQTAPFVQAFSEADVLIFQTLAGYRKVTVKDKERGRKDHAIEPRTDGYDIACALCHAQTGKCTCTVLDLFQRVGIVDHANFPRRLRPPGQRGRAPGHPAAASFARLRPEEEQQVPQQGVHPRPRALQHGKGGHVPGEIEMRYRMCTGDAVDRCTFGTYVRPLGTRGAENAWSSCPSGTGSSPEAFPHNKTVKGLHPYVRLVLPALAVTLSTLVNHPSKDPGVPMATTDGFDPAASLDHKTNFRRINGDLKRVVEEAVRAREASGSNERLDNKVKRSIAVGKHTTGKGIIGVRTRLTECVSAPHGNRGLFRAVRRHLDAGPAARARGRA